jgi:hypothetical protein
MTKRDRERVQRRLEKAEEASRRRWYIAFNVKPYLRTELPRYHRYHFHKYVWPKLYTSKDAAYDAIKTLPIFANAAPTHNRGRIISASVEATMLPKVAAHE